ncbi:hypothetical protein Tco_1012173 [Tanacetum coccineum]
MWCVAMLMVACDGDSGDGGCKGSGAAAAVGGASVGGDGGDSGGCDVGVAAGGEWRGSGVGEMMMRLRWCVGGGDVMEVVAAWSGGAFVGGGTSTKKDQGYVDSGCSRHMTGNMSCLSDFKEYDGGYVTFGGGAKGGKITIKETLKTGKLDFEDVYFVKDLQFNLFSVSQMCDKKTVFFSLTLDVLFYLLTLS